MEFSNKDETKRIYRTIRFLLVVSYNQLHLSNTSLKHSFRFTLFSFKIKNLYKDYFNICFKNNEPEPIKIENIQSIKS